MDDDERPRRPRLKRTRPVRNRSGLGGPEAPSRPTGAESGRRSDTEDVLARSVEIGYQVVDAYLDRGQEAAREIRQGRYGASELARDTGDLAERLVRGVSDAMAAWAELFELTRRDGEVFTPSGRDDDGGDPLSSGGPLPPSVPMRVSLHVDSPRAVEVTCHLESTAAGREIDAHALRSATGETRLDDVTCRTGADGVPIVRLRIARDVPAGTYDGLLIDREANVPVGRVTVSIAEPEP